MIPTSEQITNLPAVKLALLARRLEQKKKLKEMSADAQTIHRRPANAVVPLSLTQQRLWFIDQLEPGNPVYSGVFAMRAKGRLNIEALERSLNEIVRRHEMMRTTYRMQGREVVQVIAPEMKLPLPFIDLEPLPETLRVPEAIRMADEDLRRPFDLGEGPLFRAKLLRLAGEDHVLLLSMHHIATDGWSMRVTLRELTALYTDYINNLPSSLPELPIQYGDFAIWQREWMTGEKMEEQVRYWQQQLAGAPPLLEVGLDHERPAVQSYRGAHEDFTIADELWAALKELSRQEGVTLFMTLLAAFQVVLHYRSQQSDIVVGTDVAGRNCREVEGLIGFFVNQLVLRGSVAGDPSFRELLERARAACLGAYANQDVPFDKLVEVLNPVRDLSYAPLFQVKLIYQPSTTASFALPGLEWTQLEVESGTAQFDLILNVMNLEQGMIGRAEYSTDLYEAGTIKQLLRQYEQVLRAAVSNADVSVSELRAMLLEDDRQQQTIKESALAATGLERLRRAKRRTISASA